MGTAVAKIKNNLAKDTNEMYKKYQYSTIEAYLTGFEKARDMALELAIKHKTSFEFMHQIAILGEEDGDS